MKLIPRPQRIYIAEHPVVFWFSLGIALAGILSLAAPHLTEKTAAAQLLPVWLNKLFFTSYAIGGLLSFVGMSRGYRRIEAAGMALLAGGLLANFITFAYLVHASIVSALFLFFMAFGCAQRSWYLATNTPVKLEP